MFHDDTTNVFEKRKKAIERAGKRVAPSVTMGPSPFTGMSNAAAVAMAAALNRTQQPARKWHITLLNDKFVMSQCAHVVDSGNSLVPR